MRNKKLILFLMVGIILIVSSLSLVGALTTIGVFYDGFETDNFATIWTSAADYVRQSAASVDTGTYSIEVNGGVTNALMTVTNAQNISNQTTCNLTARVLIETGWDGDEFICLDYSTDGGSTWNRDAGSDGTTGGLCQDGNVDTEGAFRTISYDVTSADEIDSFKFRFRTTVSGGNEDGYIDNVNLTCSKNAVPVINNITMSDSTIKGGNTITIYANTTSHGVNDTEADTLYLYCDDTTTPTAVNTDCTGGTTSDASYPYAMTCTFATLPTDTTYNEYCRLYDSNGYSSAVNLTYITDSTAPTTSVTNVAGDPAASYFDTVNDGATEINISGEANMVCRWSSSDVVYSSMSNDCTISGTVGSCSINDIASQGYTTRYISCQDQYGNAQTTSTNLDISFYLDYTAPTTSDDSVSAVQAPPYSVTIAEADNVDSDPTSYYCTSSTQGCNSTTSIDNGGLVTYTSLNRGVNYLRYYSIDDAGNTQTTVNKTININQLPVFLSAWDDATIIKGGTTINVSANFSESDSGQEITLFVCNSSGASSSGCTGGHYCNSTNTINTSCTFTSESDSTTHTWYAYIFDELDEAASANPKSGTYTTDTTAPSITLSNPANASTITQTSVTISITVNEALTNAWYSLDDGVNNVTMTNTTLYAYSHSNTSIANGDYNLSIWANDFYGNIASSLGWVFTIDTTYGDTTAPSITIITPINNSYDTDGTVTLNITTDEALSWAGYSNKSDDLNDLDNVSTTNWNATITFAEGQHNITFYANDSSTNKNQANKSIVIYVDLTNPSVDAFSCTDVNDSKDVVCSANVSDGIGLNYAIIGYNATGSWQNSSQISLSGANDSLSYTIAAGNHSPLGFTAQIYLYDSSGRGNLTESDAITISDDTFPTIYNITYIPNTTAELDPGTAVNINATIVEDYHISSVVLMYKNSSASDWISITMTNNSAIANGSSATVVYNASFAPQEEIWYFQINATDVAGNQNISSNYTLTVENDTTQSISTTIPDIKSFTYAQRTGNNSLGWLDMNNSGDGSLGFNVSLTSSDADIQSRLSVNYTTNQSHNYSSINSGQSINITIDVNTTNLLAGLYDYNLTVISEAGAEVLEKQLNIQTAAGALLSTTITTYSSSVAPGDTNVEYVATVTNLGTADATGVYLNWTLPSDFELATGSLSRSLGNLAIGVSGSNTITIDVASGASDADVNIAADATASNANSSSNSKTITIGSPETVTIITPGTSGGGGGGGAAGAESVVYSKIIEIVRGEEDSFDIEVYNKYTNSTLEDLELELTGFLAQYISTSPSKISKINSKQSKNFTVTLKIPSYKESYEEHTLKAVIRGYLAKPGETSKTEYTETQNILLIIQEISKEKSNLSLSEAEQAIEEMKKTGFNIDEVSGLLEQAKSKLSENKNKEAQILSEKIISIRNKAFETDDLISKILEALKNPRKMGLLTGNVAKEIVDEDGEIVSINSVITGKAVFGGKSAEDVLNMAIAAFKRGDYDTANERAKSAQVLLLLERKGNFGLFLFLYWPFILFGFITFSITGIFGYKRYQKSSITKKIEDMNKEEENIRKLMQDSQKNYFTGKISSREYHRIMDQHQNKLAKIRKQRLTLRNERIKMLKSEQISQDLGIEKIQVESEIKKLQEDFYRDKKISEHEYKSQFEILNERLAEIEGERTTLGLLEGKGEKIADYEDVKKNLGKEVVKARKEVIEKGKTRIIFLKIIGFFKKPFIYFKRRKEKKRIKEEHEIKGKIKSMRIF